jgi:thiol:disulfide interchange protein
MNWLIRNIALSLFLCALSLAQAADPSHTSAGLVADKAAVAPGESFELGVLLTMEPGWHTYWKNPGDSGLATKIQWQLPPDFTADPIQWPTPHLINTPPLVSYGYEGQVLLKTVIHWPTDLKLKLGNKLEIGAKVTWLSCQESCIPGKAELKLVIPLGITSKPNPTTASAFEKARSELPTDISEKTENYQIQARANAKTFQLQITGKQPWPAQAKVYFFPDQTEAIESAAPQKFTINGNSLTLALTRPASAPELKNVSGILTVRTEEPEPFDVKLQLSTTVQAAIAPTSPLSNSASAGGNLSLIAALVFAFVGGIILNLMPCVLPVLSLKVFGFVKQAGEDHGGAWKHGVAFTVGVVISFWILAGLLLALRGAGAELGWGFQMQSPPFVAGLSVLFLLFALNLFGVFELGASLVGIDSTSAQRGGLWGSFGMGALATVAATPCTAPFMGAALGFAAAASTATALLVFTTLGLGMASPYLVLSACPALLQFVPRPGAWMESFKQFLGFLLLGTVIFLLWVFGRQQGVDAVVSLTAALLIVGFGAWIYGRWGNPSRPAFVQLLAAAFALIFLAVGTGWGLRIASLPGQPAGAAAAIAEDGLTWEPYSAQRLDALRAEGKPVFVDFTAAWCLSCKFNETMTLNSKSVREKFKSSDVVLMKGDWTRNDPEITRALAEFGRNGVPLYVLYGRDPVAVPQILPEVLTPGIVIGALERLSKP